MKQLQANLAMLGAMFLWGTSPTVTKLVLSDIGTAEIYAFRVIGGALLLWCISVFVYRKFKWNGFAPLIMGFFSPGLVTLFIILGLNHTSAVNGSVVWGVLPVIQPLLGRMFLKEPIEVSVMIGACLSIVGITILFLLKNQDGSGSLFGDFLLLCGVLSATASQILARKVAVKHGAAIVTTSYQMLVAAVLGLAILLFTMPVDEAYQAVDIPVFFLLCYLVITSAGPYFLSNFALQNMSVGRSALFSPLSGPIGVVFATIVFQEAIDLWIFVAILVALAGAFLPTYVTFRANRRHESDHRH
jgi:drug/metabolite transporter (DMT)-like permease